MGNIVISGNVSLDGVMQDPTGEEGHRFGGWFGQIPDEDRDARTELQLGEAHRTDALLFGRRSYSVFAGRWPQRGGALADRLNALPKFVVSTTLGDLAWNNSTILRGDVAEQVAALKHAVSGDIVVYASGELVRSLMEYDLVDEVRLMIYPVVLGAGRRLFGDGTESRPLRLVDTRTVGQTLVLITYERRRGA